MSEQLPARSEREQEIFALVKRAERGDAAALAEIKRDFPAALNHYGAQSDSVLGTLVAKSAGTNPLRRAGLEATLAKMRAELAGPNPSPLEGLLIERILITWMQVNRADLEALAAGKSDHSSSASIDWYTQRQALAEKRYLAAIQALAKVRKLGLPSLQVNIATHGGQQVVANLPAAGD